MLRKATTNCRVKAIPKGGNLINILPIMSPSLIKYTLKLSHICMQGISALFYAQKLVFCLLYLIRIIIYTSQLIENYIIIVRGQIVSLRQLEEDHSLNMGIEVQVDVIELRNSIANCIAINLELCFNR